MMVVQDLPDGGNGGGFYCLLEHRRPRRRHSDLPSLHVVHVAVAVAVAVSDTAAAVDGKSWSEMTLLSS